MTATPEAPRPLPSRIQLLAAILGIAGILLHFSAGFSPLDAIRQHSFTTLAAAAFISPLITILAVRLLQRGTLGPIAHTVAWLVAAAFLIIYVRGWVEALLASSEAIDIPAAAPFGSVMGVLSAALPLLFLIVGGWRTSRATWRGSREQAPILALRTMYLVNAAFALAVFASDWQVGAWCVLGAAVIHIYLIFSPAKTTQVGRSEGARS